MRSSARISLGAAIPCLLFACGDGDAPRPDWPDWRVQPDSGAWRTVVDDRHTCRDCISLSEVLVIGDPEGPGYHQESQWVTRDSLGRYWIGNTDGQKVYGPTGEFIRQVGRSGEGPLEFRGVGPLFTDRSGDVHVIDQRNRRESVIAPDFTLRSERSLPWGPVYAAAPLLGDGRIVVSGVFRAPDQVGLPLHIIDGPDLVSSFGMLERGSFSLGTMHMLRRVAVSPDGTIFSSGFFEYSVDAWDSSGKRLLGFRRLGLWEPPPGGQPQPLTVDTELWGLVLDMYADDADRLWVITWIPQPNWKANASEVVGPDGQTYLQPESNLSLRRALLEVIDLGSGQIIAHSEFEELVYGFLGPGIVFGNRFTSAGEPRLVVWNVHLSRQMETREE